MKAPIKLRFYARGESMCPDYEANARGIKRFIGRRHDPLVGELFNDPETGEAKHSGGFRPISTSESPQEVPYRAEYVRECQAGCLWPADKATADACGVPFDPTFGASAPAETENVSPIAKRIKQASA